MAIAFVAILGGSVLATRTGRKAVVSDTKAPDSPEASGVGQMAGTGYRKAPSEQPD
jgi:hypothetical protein